MDASINILIQAIDKASPGLKKLQDNLTKTERSMVEFARTAGYALGAAFGSIATAMVAVTIKTSEMIERMGEMASAAGTTVQEFSSLSYVAKTAGVSAETLSTGFKQLNKSMVEANNKSSAAAKAFKYLRVETQNADGTYRKNADVMRDVAAAFAKLPDGVSKSAVAMEIFGKSGAEMVPFLNLGAEAIKLLQEEAKRLGVVIDDTMVEKAGKLGDTIDKLKASSTGMSIVIADMMLPMVKSLTEAFIIATAKGSPFNTMLEVMVIMLKAVYTAIAAVVVVADVFTTLLGWVTAVPSLIIELGGLAGYIDFIKEQMAQPASVTWFGELTKGLWGVRTPTVKLAEATVEANKATSEYTGTNEEAAKAAAKLDAEFRKVVESLQKEADGYKDLTAVEKVLQQIRSGAYAKFTAAQQAKLISLAKEIDANEQLRDLQQKLAAGNVAVYGAASALSMQTTELAASMNVLIASGRNEQELFVQMQQPISDLTKKLGELQLAHDEALKAGENKQASKLENDIRAVESQLATYDKLAEFRRKQLEDQQRINQETKTWNTYVGDSRTKTTQLAQASATLNGWVKEGTINAHEFAVAIEKINEEKFANMRDNVTALQKKVADVAATIQSTLGDSFYNIMQGNFKNIGEMFKQMLDRMVADALAANLAKMLFGDFTNTGSVSGTGGGLLTAGVNAFLGAGFGRESGGPVTAGQAYIVGERRPELFVPQTNGTIMPDTSAINGGGGNQINFSITAMDSQDVMRAMDKIKRPLTEMINGTSKSYNMR